MNRLSIIRYLLYSLEIFITLLMQSVPYPVFELYGAKALFLLPRRPDCRLPCLTVFPI